MQRCPISCNQTPPDRPLICPSLNKPQWPTSFGTPLVLGVLQKPLISERALGTPCWYSRLAPSPGGGLCVVGASASMPGPCKSFTPAVIVRHWSEGFLPMYISLSKMPRTTHSQDSSSPSSGGTPAAETPSNTAHTSLFNPERSPNTTWDMVLPRIMSWGLVELLRRQYCISAMVSTSYAMTCSPSMSSVLMWVYACAISSSKKRNIFGQWPEQKRLTSSKFTMLRLGALKLGQPHTTSL